MKRYLMRLSTLVVICGFCSPQHLLAQSKENFIYFSGDTPYKEYWGKDFSEPSSPYILWLELEFQEQCRLPIYRTGYPADWAFMETIALKSGVKQVEVKFCTSIPGRCYMTNLNWMGSLKVFGFDEETSCNKKLIDTKWEG